ncbi:DUF1045 domain-containing protein [Arthrobacter sp. MA-N2]|uniref:DUF1045 domain-containing protein n=1 Tax=Arthrobacter sp. MA-N2 TaxID=1101188 RepID=UPI0004AD1DB8|nr:DUF1045 domain-containing protein [Arthrobacter sp. MA-N2]
MSGRVAIYAASGTSPTDVDGGQLRRRAESWLGRSVSGFPVTASSPEGWTRAAVDEITADARRYGFHGTFKAPFRLAEGRTLGELDAALARFAAGHPPVVLPELALSRIGSFFALVPGAPAEPLNALAAELVQEFDGFRAPPDAAETARRKPGALSGRQREALERWGYPYVLDDFRFHLTLTDRIEPRRQGEVDAVLRRWFADSLGRTIQLDTLALFTELAPGEPFMLHSVHPLRGAIDPLLPDLHRPDVMAEGNA